MKRLWIRFLLSAPQGVSLIGKTAVSKTADKRSSRLPPAMYYGYIMEKNIIFFTGKAQSGKNYIASCFRREKEKQGFAICEIAFADLLKEYVCTLFDISLEELNKLKLEEKPFTKNGLTMRQLLQRFGTELFRERCDRDFWIKAVAKKIVKTDYDYYLITDLRFPNELTVIRYCADYDTSGCAYKHKVVMVINGDTIKSSQHRSEQYVDSMPSDIVINNTNHLYQFNINDFL